MCAGEFNVVGELNSHDGEAKCTIQQMSFQVPEPDFYLTPHHPSPGSFHVPSILFVCTRCTTCPECRETPYCVVVQGMRWCFASYLCHKWSILGVRFQVKVNKCRNSRASALGVPILFCSCGDTPTSSQVFQSWRASSGILRVLLALTWGLKLCCFKTNTLDFSVAVMKCLQCGNTEQSLWFLHAYICFDNKKKSLTFCSAQVHLNKLEYYQTFHSFS